MGKALGPDAWARLGQTSRSTSCPMGLMSSSEQLNLKNAFYVPGMNMGTSQVLIHLVLKIILGMGTKVQKG